MLARKRGKGTMSAESSDPRHRAVGPMARSRTSKRSKVFVTAPPLTARTELVTNAEDGLGGPRHPDARVLIHIP
jgi:hypothetical protein